jgi:signal transduction histidine kinase
VFPANELWLVGQGPQTNGRSLVVVTRAENIRKSVEEDRSQRGKEQPFRFARNGEAGYPMGDGLPGLSAVLEPAGGGGSSAMSGPGVWQQLFIGLSLALILGLTFFGARLMLRDARRESRLAELRSQFVSSVSHELKTPLTGIRMLAETLQTPAASDPLIHAEYLDTIVGETERLTRLLNNVLDFSKIERGQKSYHMETASLADVLRSVARAMRFPLAEQGFDFSIEIADGVPPARIDRDAIEQAVLNLLSNAMKYSGKSRAIGLRLAVEERAAVIQVVDRGIGIPPGERKRIFEKFYRVQTPENRAISGTGLGLALVAHIVDAHGGRIDVESAVGQGSTFTIRIPVAPQVTDGQKAASLVGEAS